MNIIKKIPATLLISLSLISSFAIASVEEDVSTLQKGWEKVKYQSPESAHEKECTQTCAKTLKETGAKATGNGAHERQACSRTQKLRANVLEFSH